MITDEKAYFVGKIRSLEVNHLKGKKRMVLSVGNLLIFSDIFFSSFKRIDFSFKIFYLVDTLIKKDKRDEARIIKNKKTN